MDGFEWQGTYASERPGEDVEDVELVLRRLAGSVFLSVFTGDKVLRQLTPTGIIIPIIKQFSKHIRNPSIKS